MAIDGAEVTESEFFEKDVGKNEVLGTFLDAVGDFSNGFSEYAFHEVGRSGSNS